jgi:hypothetical protein
MVYGPIRAHGPVYGTVMPFNEDIDIDHHKYNELLDVLRTLKGEETSFKIGIRDEKMVKKFVKRVKFMKTWADRMI